MDFPTINLKTTVSLQVLSRIISPPTSPYNYLQITPYLKLKN